MYVLFNKLDANIVLKERDLNPKFIKKSDNSIRRKPTVEKLVIFSPTVMVVSSDEIQY